MHQSQEDENKDTQAEKAADLKGLGIDDENIKYFLNLKPIHYDIAIKTIVSDIEPSDELLKKVTGDYKNINFLTQGEVQAIIQYERYHAYDKHRSSMMPL